MDVLEKQRLARRLRSARLMSGLTQHQVAVAAELGSATVVSGIECAKRSPEPATLARIAAALGVREEWLATGEGRP